MKQHWKETKIVLEAEIIITEAIFKGRPAEAIVEILKDRGFDVGNEFDAKHEIEERIQKREEARK